MLHNQIAQDALLIRNLFHLGDAIPVPMETLLPIPVPVLNAWMVKNQTQLDQIAPYVTMVLKLHQQKITVQNAPMAQSQTIMLTQIVADVVMAVRHWPIDQTVHCKFILTLDAPMVLKPIPVEVIAIGVYIQ